MELRRAIPGLKSETGHPFFVVRGRIGVRGIPPKRSLDGAPHFRGELRAGKHGKPAGTTELERRAL